MICFTVDCGLTGYKFETSSEGYAGNEGNSFVRLESAILTCDELF